MALGDWTNTNFGSFAAAGNRLVIQSTGQFQNGFLNVNLIGGQQYTIKFNANIISGTWILRDQANTTTIAPITNGDNDITFTMSGAGNQQIRIQSSGTGTTDIDLGEFGLVIEGLVAAYQPEGIATDQSIWFDRSTNNLDGTITGAQGVLNPGNSIYFAKFTEVNAQFWFLELNPDSLTYVGPYKVGQWDLCKVFRPSTNPNLTDLSETLNYDGIDTIAKYGGGTDLNERHGRRKVWQFTYTFFSETDRTNFTNLLEQSKKRPFYFSLNADEKEPIIYAGRILGNPQIVPVAFERYSIQFEIIEEP